MYVRLLFKTAIRHLASKEQLDVCHYNTYIFTTARRINSYYDQQSQTKQTEPVN